MDNLHWTETTLAAGSTLRQAIERLDHSGLQIVLVVTGENTLCGTVTDGDIRRALLRGASLDDSIDNIMVRSPMVAPPEMGRDMVLHLMQANKVHQLPVVDENRRLVGLHVWDDVITPRRRDNPVVVMAGGLGTRLRPLTQDCPKPMLPVGGKPMLEHIVERAKHEGFHRFVFAINYLGHMIEDHFGNGEELQVSIEYVREDQPLGTAGALGLLSPRPELPFIVTNGDVLTDVRYGEMLDFHLAHQAMATMAIRQHEWQHPFGVVRTQGIDITGFDEKPIHRTHVNAGIYALDPAALNALQEGASCHMPELFEKLRAGGAATIAFPLHEPWLDVGRPTDLVAAEESVSK